MVAFSSAAFFSSMMTSGRPFTNSSTSGRRLCPFSMIVNWLTTVNSLFHESSKSISHTLCPRSMPSWYVETGTPSVSSRWNASLLASTSGDAMRSTVFTASSRSSSVSVGFNRFTACSSFSRSTISSNILRIGISPSGAIVGPYRYSHRFAVSSSIAICSISDSKSLAIMILFWMSKYFYSS